MASWVSFLIKNAELNDSFVFEVHRALCIEESWLRKLSQTSSPRDCLMTAVPSGRWMNGSLVGHKLIDPFIRILGAALVQTLLTQTLCATFYAQYCCTYRKSLATYSQTVGLVFREGL